MSEVIVDNHAPDEVAWCSAGRERAWRAGELAPRAFCIQAAAAAANEIEDEVV